MPSRHVYAGSLHTCALTFCAAAMAKAKATKHTAAELAAKAKAALQNKGGGNAGKAGEWRHRTDDHAALEVSHTEPGGPA